MDIRPISDGGGRVRDCVLYILKDNTEADEETEEGMMDGVKKTAGEGGGKELVTQCARSS